MRTLLAPLGFIPSTEHLVNIFGDDTLAVHLQSNLLRLQWVDRVHSSRVSPLFHQDSITHLAKETNDLVPSIGSANVDQDVPVGIGGLVDLLDIVSKEERQCRRAGGLLVLQRGGELDGGGVG